MKFSFTHSWSRSNQCFVPYYFPWKLYFCVLSFYFLSSDSLWMIITTCTYNPFFKAIFFKAALASFVIFALPIGTPNIWSTFVSPPLNLVWIFFHRNLVHVSWNFLLTTHIQDQTNVFFLLIFLGSYIFLSCLFFFLLCNSLLWIITACVYNSFSKSHVFKICLDFIWYVLRLILIIYIGLKILLETILLLQNNHH